MTNQLASFADLLKQMVHRFKNQLCVRFDSENLRLQQNHPSVRFPPCDLAYTALSHCDYRRYLDSGQAHASFIMQIIRNHSSSQQLAICEWGCGPGRVIQHLNNQDNGISRLIGTDCHHASITWCRDNLPTIEFLHHAPLPPLDLASNSLDVIYCCAVFSHLAEAQHHAWISEILRLLRPGGLLIATLNGSHFEDRMTTIELADYNSGKLVVRASGAEGSTDFASFAGEDFVRNRLLNRFANVTCLKETPFIQSVWTATAL